jgi:hypothetical protein
VQHKDNARRACHGQPRFPFSSRSKKHAPTP